MGHPFGADYIVRMGTLPGAAQAWVDGVRQSGRAVLAARGLPGPREEAWRYTLLSDVAKTPFIPAAAADDVDVASVPAQVPRIPGLTRLVMVNGVMRRDLSDAWPVMPGSSLVTLRDALQSVDGPARAFAGHIAPATTWPMAALNASFLAEGVVIDVGPGSKSALHIVSIGAAGTEPLAFHPRMIAAVGDGAELTLVVSHVGLPGQCYFSNPVSEFTVGRGGTLRHFVDIAEDGDAVHAGVTAVRLDSDASYEDFRLSIGGGKVRQDVDVVFTGPGARAVVRGAYALTRTEHHDLSTSILHRVPGCTSSQEIRGVVGGQSHAVFQGRVQVAREAQKSDARQHHKALFLTAGPRVDCKPELEIFADDVQCAHGATTGEIDQDQLFYLMARGIPPDAARALLVEGFLDDVVQKISHDGVRNAYISMVAMWLKARSAGVHAP